MLNQAEYIWLDGTKPTQELRSKTRILEHYLNLAPYGGNVRGVEAAARRYFGRSCRNLSLGQAALLAGLPQSPARYRPDRFPERAAARRMYVLERMHSAGMISSTQKDQAAANQAQRAAGPERDPPKTMAPPSEKRELRAESHQMISVELHGRMLHLPPIEF